MRNLFTKFVGLCALVVVVSSCEKDETQAVLNPGAAPTLTASGTTATLVQTNASANSVTYSWPAVDYGYQAAVNYTLQFAKQGTNFASPFEVNMGPALTKTFTVGELNAAFAGADCASANQSTRLDVRVKASVGDRAPIMYSNVSTIQATPYPAAAPADNWGIIGSATPGGWNSDTDLPYDFCSRTYKATLPLVAGEYKFRANDDWGNNLGDDGNDGALEANGANIVLATGGNYTVELNMRATPKPTFTITRR